MNFINKQRVLDVRFCLKNGNDVAHVWARSEAAARQKGVEYFKLSHKESLNLKVIPFKEKQ